MYVLIPAWQWTKTPRPLSSSACMKATAGKKWGIISSFTSSFISILCWIIFYHFQRHETFKEITMRWIWIRTNGLTLCKGTFPLIADTTLRMLCALNSVLSNALVMFPIHKLGMTSSIAIVGSVSISCSHKPHTTRPVWALHVTITERVKKFATWFSNGHLFCLTIW